jgi:hypothetical protein
VWIAVSLAQAVDEGAQATLVPRPEMMTLEGLES